MQRHSRLDPWPHSPGCRVRQLRLVYSLVPSLSPGSPHTVYVQRHSLLADRLAVPRLSEPSHVLQPRSLLPAIMRSLDRSVPRSDSPAPPRTDTERRLTANMPPYDHP